MRRLGLWLREPPSTRLGPFAVPSRGFGLLFLLLGANLLFGGLFRVEAVDQAVPDILKLAVVLPIGAGIVATIVALWLVREERG